MSEAEKAAKETQHRKEAAEAAAKLRFYRVGTPKKKRGR